jgi:phytoene dehydrogenase-like protein
MIRTFHEFALARVQEKEFEMTMKQPRNDQEVIVLGSGLGGLVAGTLLSRNNHSVLLLREKGYQSSYSTQGYHFLPFSNFSEKSLKPSLVRKISQTLNLSLLMGTRENGKHAKAASDRLKQRTISQVVLPRARIDIFSERSLSQKEWKREFPKEVSQIEEFYGELDQIQPLLEKENWKKHTPAFFPFRRRSFINNIFSFDPFPKEKMDKRLSPFSKEFREFVQLQLISRGNFYSDQFPLSLVTQVLFDGIDELNSDIDSEKVEKELINQFLRSGGRIEEIDGVKEMRLDHRKGVLLTLEGNPVAFRPQFLVINSPLHRISPFLGKKGKRLSKWEKKIKPLYMMIPLFLGIHEKVVPIGMKDLVLSIMDLEKPHDDGNLLFLSLSQKGDETRAPAGRRALTVESLMEVGKWEQTPLAEYQRGVMKHLYYLFPFLENYTEFVDFQWANDQVPKWSYSHFLYQATSDFCWREGVVPMRISKNIYFVGKENFPYLGLGGEVFSGLTVAQQILKKKI